MSAQSPTKVVLNAHHDATTCTWCEKERECVTATFADSFLKAAPLCWKCLQTAFKVRSKQNSAEPPPKENR